MRDWTNLPTGTVVATILLGPHEPPWWDGVPPPGTLIAQIRGREWTDGIGPWWLDPASYEVIGTL
jgi:hypothetical protein